MWMLLYVYEENIKKPEEKLQEIYQRDDWHSCWEKADLSFWVSYPSTRYFIFYCPVLKISFSVCQSPSFPPAFHTYTDPPLNVSNLSG